MKKYEKIDTWILKMKEMILTEPMFPNDIAFITCSREDLYSWSTRERTVEIKLPTKCWKDKNRAIETMRSTSGVDTELLNYWVHEMRRKILKT